MIDEIKALFRPVYVPLIEKYRHWNRECAFVKGLGNRSGNVGYIIGTPVYSNLGDSAICIAQQCFLDRCGCPTKEITYKEYYDFHKKIRRIIKKEAPIFGLGGGNMGNQWPAEELIRCEVSIGVAAGMRDFDTLVQSADKALYRAKVSGRNRVVCD